MSQQFRQMRSIKMFVYIHKEDYHYPLLLLHITIIIIIMIVALLLRSPADEAPSVPPVHSPSFPLFVFNPTFLTQKLSKKHRQNLFIKNRREIHNASPVSRHSSLMKPLL